MRGLLRRGLPATAASVPGELLELRGVVARAADPTDAASRVAALNGLLRGVLARFEDARYAGAARALFGLAPGEPGTTLTARRAAAAGACGREVHHFRKRLEPRLVQRVAWELERDAERFRTFRIAAPRLSPAGEHPAALPADVFAWELAEHEEQLSGVWAAVYGLRAELLSLERMASMGADRQEVIARAVTAAWRFGLLHAAAQRYLASYPPGSLGAVSELSAADLAALAGWTPPLAAAAVARLAEAAARFPDRAGFVAAMRAEVELGNAWCQPWLDRRDDEENVQA